MTLIKITWLILHMMMLSACSPLAFKGKDGTVQYVILGFGIVSVPKSEGEVAVTGAKTRTFGIGISNQPGMKFSLGYTSGFFISVPDHAKDVRLEVYERPGGSISIDTANAELNSTLQEEKNNEK